MAILGWKIEIASILAFIVVAVWCAFASFVVAMLIYGQFAKSLFKNRESIWQKGNSEGYRDRGYEFAYEVRSKYFSTWFGKIHLIILKIVLGIALAVAIVTFAVEI